MIRKRPTPQYRAQADGYYLHKPRHIFHEKGMSDTLSPEKRIHANRSFMEHEIFANSVDARRDSKRELKPHGSAARFDPALNRSSDDIQMRTMNDQHFNLPAKEGLRSAEQQSPAHHNQTNPEFYPQSSPSKAHWLKRSEYLMAGRPLCFRDGSPNITHGKRQIMAQRDTLFNNREDGVLDSEPRALYYGPYTDQPSNGKQPPQTYLTPQKRQSMTSPKKLRNGIDIEQPRVENLQSNHRLPFPVVNGKYDRSNVRNNKKTWSKDLQAEFVPPPMYDKNGYNIHDDKNSVDIQGRQEYADLEGFPKSRKKNFNGTLQPNRYIFRGESADGGLSRPGYSTPGSRGGSVSNGGRSNTYVIDPKFQHLNGDGTPCKVQRTHHGNNGHTDVLYGKRTDGGRMPPYTDFKYFSRTRQAFINPDYVRDRAARTLGQNPHRHKPRTAYMDMEEERIRSENKRSQIEDIPYEGIDRSPERPHFEVEMGHEQDADAEGNSPMYGDSPANRNRLPGYKESP